MTHSVRFAVLVLAGALALTAFAALPTTSLAQEGEEEGVTVKMKKSVDATCMQTAVDTREDALQDAWDAFGDDVASALVARKSALHDAWGLSDQKERKAAIVKAWKAWKSASKTAHKDLKGDRKAAWDAFRKTVKDTCKVTTPKEESLGTDESGSISL